MKRTIEYIIDKKSSGMKILDFLKSKNFPYRAIVQLKKTEKGILLNNEWAYVNQIVKIGDYLSVQFDEQESEDKIISVSLPFEILYEDEDIIICNKPPFMATHPSMKHYTDTLANAVRYHAIQKGEWYPTRCLNRLDRDTSGIVIMSKNLLAAGILSNQMKEGLVKKEYVAIVEGKTPDYGIIEKPIARKEGSVIERCIDYEKGEYSLSEFYRISNNNFYSLVRLIPHTGRTHQLRVHLLSIDHPIIGDFLYNPKESPIKRQALHCSQIAFRHPVTNKEMLIEAPLPDDMKTAYQ